MAHYALQCNIIPKGSDARQSLLKCVMFAQKGALHRTPTADKAVFAVMRRILIRGRLDTL